MRLVEVPITEEHRWDSNETAYSNRQEHESALLSVEVVDRAEDVGECREEAEEYGEVECHVETQESHDGLGDKHVERPEDGDGEEELEFCLSIWEW